MPVNDLSPTSRIEEDEPLSPADKRPFLTILQGEKVGLTLELQHERTIIGRGTQAHLMLNDQRASRQHAEIVRAGGDHCEFHLTDLSSTNGTILNGVPVETQQRLRDGDKIKIGKHILRFSMLELCEVEALSKSRSQAGENPEPVDDSASRVLSFPPFHIVVDVDLLYRGEAVVPLEPRAVRVLKYLAEHSGRVVSKDELLEAVWPDVFTSDGVLKKAISQARHALSDDPRAAKFIETYHRRGYRFIGSVERSAEPQP
jgi:DNA-binding winged helix-turn-helix (wHTH) protein